MADKLTPEGLWILAAEMRTVPGAEKVRAYAIAWEAMAEDHLAKLMYQSIEYNKLREKLEQEIQTLHRQIEAETNVLLAHIRRLEIRIEEAVTALIMEALLQRVDDVHSDPVLADRLSNIAGALVVKELRRRTRDFDERDPDAVPVDGA